MDDLRAMAELALYGTLKEARLARSARAMRVIGLPLLADMPERTFEPPRLPRTALPILPLESFVQRHRAAGPEDLWRVRPVEPWLQMRRARLVMLLGPAGADAFDLAVKSGMEEGMQTVHPNHWAVEDHLDHVIALAEAGEDIPQSGAGIRGGN